MKVGLQIGCLILCFVFIPVKSITVEEIVNYINGTYENEFSNRAKEQNIAEWNYATNITDENNEKSVNITLANSKADKQAYDTYFKDVKLDDVTDENIKRQLKFLKIIGRAALDEKDLKNLTEISNKMTDIYSVGKICPYKNQQCDLSKQGLSLEPGIESVLASSVDYDELTYVWKAWRKATGEKIRENYKTYVELVNKAAKLNGYENNAAMWMADYETESFVSDMDKLWEQVRSLYEKLHSYVRSKLVQRYGADKLGTDSLIPAHLFGNMWAQSWVNLGKLVRPFPKESAVDVTATMVEQKYTPRKMFEMSNEFYTSLGLPSNDMSYGNDCLIEKPKDREVLCHASAWDFSDKKTFRIKMCTEVNNEDFVTVHHEMGHIQYYIQYKDQPITFRTGANPGFHEAVGDTIALSVATPKHLEKIGLLKNYKNTKRAAINALMDMALERVAFLPFGLLIDKWRWDVFSGNVSSNKWNEHWWKLREKYQQVKAPIERSENDFDPGAKFHVAGDSQYINYFVAHILEFQLYRSLCITAGEYDPKTKNPPLHQCDFYKSTKVGDKLKAGLSLGSSVHWKEVLKVMTGEEELDATAILDYFQPLINYLNGENIPEENSSYAKSGSVFLTTIFAITLALMFN